MFLQYGMKCFGRQMMSWRWPGWGRTGWKWKRKGGKEEKRRSKVGECRLRDVGQYMRRREDLGAQSPTGRVPFFNNSQVLSPVCCVAPPECSVSQQCGLFTNGNVCVFHVLTTNYSLWMCMYTERYNIILITYKKKLIYNLIYFTVFYYR